MADANSNRGEPGKEKALVGGAAGKSLSGGQGASKPGSKGAEVGKLESGGRGRVARATGDGVAQERPGQSSGTPIEDRLSAMASGKPAGWGRTDLKDPLADALGMGTYGSDGGAQAGERCTNWTGQDGWAPSYDYEGRAGACGDYVEAVLDFVGGAEDFLNNRSQMVAANTHGADKYYHCMANCQATGRGAGGEMAAYIMSTGREAADAVRNVLPKELFGKGLSWEASKTDIREDLSANRVGREGARAGVRCYDACTRYRPNGW